MLNDKQIQRMLRKLKRFEDTLDHMIFEKVCDLPTSLYETKEQLYNIPEDSLYHSVQPGDMWGGENVYGWFKTTYQVPEEYAGRPLFLRPQVGGYEALLWVDGKPFGTYATKIVVTGHGNHYCASIQSLRPSCGRSRRPRQPLLRYAGEGPQGWPGDQN